MPETPQQVANTILLLAAAAEKLHQVTSADTASNGILKAIERLTKNLAEPEKPV